MEREFEFRTYDFNGEIGVVLMNMWDGSYSTNIEEASRPEGSISTRIKVPYEETGVKLIDNLTRGEESVLEELFDLKNR